MVDLIPKLEEESDQEDIELVQDDIDQLARKYIYPIDRIRSIDKDGNRSDRPIESRIHAFLRYIGFPVVGDGNFYNSGHPPVTGKAQESRDRVDLDYESNVTLRSLVQKRERDWEQRLQIFSRRDLSSAVYSLVLTEVRPFNMLNQDNQNIEIAPRNTLYQQLVNNNKRLNFSNVPSNFSNVDSVGSNINGVRHILRPFSLDPNIVNSVNPDSAIIGKPFRKDIQELTITDEAVALRPGIELIIAERLRDRSASDQNGLFLKNLETLLSGEEPPGLVVDTSVNDIKLTLRALAEDNQITSGTLNDLSEITNIQVYVISLLVKTIKQLTRILFNSIRTIQEIREEINWLPVVNALGPELDPREPSTDVTVIQNNISRGNLDRQLIELKAKKVIANSRIIEDQNFGNYASPFEVKANDTNIQEIESQIQGISQSQVQLMEQGFLALRNIELISGEISGIGLIDILSIYVALWAMDEQGLISLLDDDSFDSLKRNFEELLVGAAAARAGGENTPGVKDNIDVALEKFESKLKNVLDFAQKEFDSRGQVPGEEEGGTISADA